MSPEAALATTSTSGGSTTSNLSVGRAANLPPSTPPLPPQLQHQRQVVTGGDGGRLGVELVLVCGEKDTELLEAVCGVLVDRHWYIVLTLVWQIAHAGALIGKAHDCAFLETFLPRPPAPTPVPHLPPLLWLPPPLPGSTVRL
jgi:hypothetical protein